MPKGRSKDKPAAGGAPSDSKPGKGKAGKKVTAKRAKLEKKLAKAVREEARRRGQYEQAAADRAALAGQLLELTQGAPVAPPVPSADVAAHADAAPPAAAPAGSPTEVVTAFCLRQKKRVTLQNPEPVTLRNGRRAVAGTCPECGARIVRMGS